MVNTNREYTSGFRYIMTKYFALFTPYDTDTATELELR
ncbi:hypothetical protein J2W55_004627 [Mucilaginibacter pocheonensis]|uniref:Uncharacterized protein n=1 Tax=Mucilaginibacter pocheonensis TaxID=398050 RepID=A0ABU1TH79_9SPHI|nr:hypothetical protein [Mucilaginibacter pocheonensis]